MNQERHLWCIDGCVSKGLKNGRILDREGRLRYWEGRVRTRRGLLAFGGRVAWGIWRTPHHSIWLRHPLQKEERADVARDEVKLGAYCKASCKEVRSYLRLTGSQRRVLSRGARWIRFTFCKDYLLLVYCGDRLKWDKRGDREIRGEMLEAWSKAMTLGRLHSSVFRALVL